MANINFVLLKKLLILLTYSTCLPFNAFGMPKNVTPLSAITTSGAESSTTFGFSVVQSSTGSFVEDATVSDKLAVKLYIEPSDKHVNDLADIFIVVSDGNNDFLLGSDGSLSLFSPGVDKLVPALKNTRLVHNLEIDIGTISFENAGDYKFFAGYILQGTSELNYSSDGSPLSIALPGRWLTESKSEVSSGTWKKTVDVFGVYVKATNCVSDTKVMHAASVLAEYLDNDNNGVVDNSAVVDRLKANGSANGFIGMSCSDEVVDGNRGVTLFDDETRPEGSLTASTFDATLEEVLHLITGFGYAGAYSSVFGERKGTTIANAMDTARGGYQGSGQPVSLYPAGAWYTYDDVTCDYACMVTEYFYWGLTSILGAQDYAGRCAEIKVEWDLCSRAQVQATDPTLYNLLTNPIYSLPTQLPDGTYTGKTLTIVSD